MDHIAIAYQIVRDNTFCNENLEARDSIAILELIKAECVQSVQTKILADKLLIHTVETIDA